MSLNIVITGGSGFLGKHLCRSLSALSHKIKVIDLQPNPEFDTVICDIRDTERMVAELKGADVVFHLASLIEAGESVQQPQKYVDYNITGSVSVLEAMRLNDVKTFIFSSSAAIYGEPLHIPIKEDDRTIPINPYGMTKLALEGLLSSYVSNFGFTGIALRYFNLYGPGESHEPETHAIPRFIKQIHEGTEVTVWGSGEHKRDYIHIQDIVAAHVGALELAQAKPQQYHYFNLSTERPSSVIDIVHAIETAMNKTANIKNFPPRPGDPLVLVANASKAKEQLGWSAHISLEEGIKETVTWFLEQWRSNE